MNEAERLLAEIVRIGTVMDIDENKQRARVLFRDRQNMVSDFFPLLLPYSGGTGHMPEIGDTVLCLYLPFDSRGFILGRFTKERED